MEKRVNDASHRNDFSSSGLILLRLITQHLPGTIEGEVRSLLKAWDEGCYEYAIQELLYKLKAFLKDSTPDELWYRQGCALVLAMTTSDRFKRPSATQVLSDPFLLSSLPVSSVSPP